MQAVKIFISHSWIEDSLYRKLVELLNNELGQSGWHDLSVSKDHALNMISYGERGHEQEMDLQEAELIRLQEQIDSIDRWDEPERSRILDEQRFVGDRISSLNNMMTPSDYNRYSRATPFPRPGKLDDSYMLDPTLSLAIRQRIAEANVILLILKPYCHWKRWIDFEIKIAIDRVRPIIGIVAQPDMHISRDVRHYCNQIVDWGPLEIKHALRSFCGEIHLMTNEQLEHIKSEIQRAYRYLLDHSNIDPLVVELIKRSALEEVERSFQAQKPWED